MKRFLYLSLTAALVGGTGAAQAGPMFAAGGCGSAAPCPCAAPASSGCCGGNHCKEVPCAECPDCCPPCQGHHHCSAWKSEHARELLQDLCSCDCHTRIKAAKKLGHRINGNFCCDCAILPGLVHALLCDKCWEVRQAAAWSIARQGARTNFGLTALYVSSRLDHHYMVRAKAKEALDQLILCRKPCYKEIFKAADALVVQLKMEKVRPGTDNCEVILGSLNQCGCCSTCGSQVIIPSPVMGSNTQPVAIHLESMPQVK